MPRPSPAHRRSIALQHDEPDVVPLPALAQRRQARQVRRAAASSCSRRLSPAWRQNSSKRGMGTPVMAAFKRLATRRRRTVGQRRGAEGMAPLRRIELRRAVCPQRLAVLQQHVAAAMRSRHRQQRSQRAAELGQARARSARWHGPWPALASAGGRRACCLSGRPGEKRHAAAARNLSGRDVDGSSLHAAVRCAADDRQALEQLCRYIGPPDTGQQARAGEHRRTGGVEAEDPLARRDHAPGHVAAGRSTLSATVSVVLLRPGLSACSPLSMGYSPGILPPVCEIEQSVGARSPIWCRCERSLRPGSG